EVLGDMARILLRDRGGGLLIGAHDRPQVFRIELAGKLGGAHEIAEEHGELPSFRLGWHVRGARDLDDIFGGGGRGTVTVRLLGSPPYCCGQRRPAAIAELALSLNRRAAAGADVTEQRAAVAAESRPLTVLGLAPRTLHPLGPFRLGIVLRVANSIIVGNQSPRRGRYGKSADQNSIDTLIRMWLRWISRCVSYIEIGGLMDVTAAAGLARGTLASLLLLLLWATGAEAQAPVTLKLATIVGADNPFSTAAVRFKEVAEAKSGGRIKVEVYPAGQLAKNETAMLESMQLGTVDVGAIVTPSIGGKWDPKFLAPDVPFLWESREHIWKVMDGSVGRDLLKRLEPLGAHGFCFRGGFCFRNVLVNKLPIRIPPEYQGDI